MSRSRTLAVPLIALLAIFTAFGLLATLPSPVASQEADDADRRASFFERIAADGVSDHIVSPEFRELQSFTLCENGMAGIYPCDNVDLLAFVPKNDVGGGGGLNDIWGWTDPQSGVEYALVGRHNGTSFVDVSDPENPLYLGNLPTHTSSPTWRDVKVYADHAFIVSEAAGHGVQVFDLTQLRNVPNPPVTFSETTHYGGDGGTHNIVINEETGYAYTVGGNTCGGGLHMINIQDPVNPTFAGCFSSDGYTHDAQCVVYDGPDTDYQGDEVCFNSNEDTLTIVNVEDKSNPVQIARQGYSGAEYTHQGWLSEDQQYFFQGDELDEQYNGNPTRTLVWDVSDLDSPTLVDAFDGPTNAIDHNMYVHEGMLYQSNYEAGVYILDATDPLNLEVVGFFDLHPDSNNTSFQGTWSNYPYFESGIIVATHRQSGLFVLRYNDADPPAASLLHLPLVIR